MENDIQTWDYPTTIVSGLTIGPYFFSEGGGKGWHFLGG